MTLKKHVLSRSFLTLSPRWEKIRRMETMRRIPQEEMKNCTSVGPDCFFLEAENRFNRILLPPPWEMRLPMGEGGDHR